MQNNTTKNIRITARALLLNYARTHVLLVRHAGSQTFATPGGGIEEADEHTVDCLKRELKEELGIEAHIEHLVFSREFVRTEKTLIEFYFLASLSTDVELDLNFQDEAHKDGVGGVEERRWVSIKDIDTIEVFPHTVKNIQQILDNTLTYRHVITTLLGTEEKNIFF